MPLRDHFHSPMIGRHRWDKLLGGWPMKIVEEPQLPRKYTAAPQVHLGGGVEIDVGTYEQLDAIVAEAPNRRRGCDHTLEGNGTDIAG